MFPLVLEDTKGGHEYGGELVGQGAQLGGGERGGAGRDEGGGEGGGEGSGEGVFRRNIAVSYQI